MVLAFNAVSYSLHLNDRNSQVGLGTPIGKNVSLADGGSEQGIIPVVVAYAFVALAESTYAVTAGAVLAVAAAVGEEAYDSSSSSAEAQLD